MTRYRINIRDSDRQKHLTNVERLLSMCESKHQLNKDRTIRLAVEYGSECGLLFAYIFRFTNSDRLIKVISKGPGVGYFLELGHRREVPDSPGIFVITTTKYDQSFTDGQIFAMLDIAHEWLEDWKENNEV